MINRQEFDKIKEKLERNKRPSLLEIIQSAEEFGAIDGRRERQEANTTALRKVLTDCGFKVQGMGFGDMLYELRKAMEGGESEAPKQPKVLDADGVEIKPGDELYYSEKSFSPGIFAGTVAWVHTDRCPVPTKDANKQWVRYEDGGWDLAERLTHQKPETLQDVIEDIDKCFNEYWGCTGYGCEECPTKINGETPDDYYKTNGNCHIAMHKDIKRRLEAIAKRMGGDA